MIAVWRILSLLMLLVFVLAIVVQYNDPDPALWMLLYAVPAVISALAAGNKFYRASILIASGYFLLALFRGPDWRNVDSTIFRPHLEMMGDDIERAREVIGLLIAAAWMACTGFVAHGRSRRIATL